MTYRVELTDRAARDLVILCEDKNVAGSVAAARWYNPGRCQMAPESGRAGRPLRHLLYGKKPHVYRVIYAIDERKKLVRVLTIRHPAMAPAALHE
jgi:mRNA-degrading endonuclease RelE of RelBE toxin-antitoxin system